MATLVSTFERPVESAAPARTARRAFYLTSQGSPMFAWLNEGVESPLARHGVVVCAPAGHEQVHTHRTLRHFAERSAAAGFSVVRFDFQGTGDSADLAHDADPYPTWVANLRDIIAWMREQLGCSHISLMGLRLGATLAAQVAADLAIENLILWEPVVSGRSYSRELKALSMMGSSKRDESSGDFEPGGFVFNRKLLDELGRVDLLKVRPLCRRALILARDDMPANGKLLQHLSALGIEAEQAAFPGYTDMMAEPHKAKVPQQAIATTQRWLLADSLALTENPVLSSTAGSDIGAASVLMAGYGDEPVRERIVQISQQPDLFGILSEPIRAEKLPLIVLPNAGSAYRVGPGRLHIMLARQLAQRGFRTLRMDLSGLGDSVTTDPKQENDCYAEAAFRDIDITLRFAQTELAAERVVLMGLCSGAYVAFQSAAQIVNPALVESVLINPLTFYWKAGMTIEDSPVQKKLAVQYYLTSAWQSSKWIKLLTGRTKIGMLGALKLLATKFGMVGRQQVARVDASAIPLGHPAKEDLPGDLQRVEQVGRQLAFFFARSDPGYGMLMSAASRHVKQMCTGGKASVHFIDDADHTFSRQGARRTLIDSLYEYLRQRYEFGFCNDQGSSPERHRDEKNK